MREKPCHAQERKGCEDCPWRECHGCLGRPNLRVGAEPPIQSRHMKNVHCLRSESHTSTWWQCQRSPGVRRTGHQNMAGSGKQRGNRPVMPRSGAALPLSWSPMRIPLRIPMSFIVLRTNWSACNGREGGHQFGWNCWSLHLLQSSCGDER